MLGLLEDFARGSDRHHGELANVSPLLLAVESSRGIEAVAMQTPPRALITSRAADEAVRALAEFVLAERIPLPGVTGPVASSQRFAADWAAATGGEARVRTEQKIYELTRVESPPFCPGALREATADDERVLAQWSDVFHRELNLDRVDDHLALVRAKRAAGQLFVWERDVAVSMAAWTGRTSQGVCVAYVYTPPSERRKGYASAAVAALSQRLLDEGSPRCFLFTDAANPTSNKIYAALGYRPVCDFRLYDFFPA